MRPTRCNYYRIVVLSSIFMSAIVVAYQLLLSQSLLSRITNDITALMLNAESSSLPFSTPFSIFSSSSSVVVQEGEESNKQAVVNNSNNVTILIDNNDRRNSSSSSSSSSSSNHRTPASWSSLPPKPIQAMKQYIQWHSQQALEQEYKSSSSSSSKPEWNNQNNRIFAIGYYSCPMQAGNRLFHFFNSLKWAIVTNRTLLWKYYDNATCQENERTDIRFQYGVDQVCAATQTEDHCAEFLTRALWIPSYDEWKDKLLLASGDEQPVRLHFWSTTPKYVNLAARKFERFEGYEQHAGVDAKTHLRFVNFPIQVGPTAYMQYKKKNRDYLLHTEFGRTTALQLFDEGYHFLYGMLFHMTFDFVNKLEMPSAQRIHKNNNNNSLNIGIHARHQLESDTGEDVFREKQCLKKFLSKRLINNNSSSQLLASCHVYIMSDRAATIKNLIAWLQEEKNDEIMRNYNCTVHVANHTAASSSNNSNNSSSLSSSAAGLSEHGPFAGGGFINDLQLVSQGARDAFIGTITSSSQLVLSLIEYNRAMEEEVEAWQQPRDGQGRGEELRKPLDMCEIKAK